MGDLGPTAGLVAERLRLQIMELEVNIQKQGIRIMELEEEKQKIQANREATKEAIKKLNEQVSQLSI
jgi:hypothetical protein